jgi:hypothetical protein
MERLFELLREDTPLPPSEVDVERAMRAGRRRVRGRWISAAAVVAVVLSVVSVIAAIGRPAVETAKPPGDFDPMRQVIVVDDPSTRIFHYTTARRWQDVTLGGSNGGWLTVYAPGRMPTDGHGPMRPETGSPAGEVNGKPAYWITKQRRIETAYGPYAAGEVLAWQWADGAWALLQLLDRDATRAPDRKAMLRVAPAVRVTAGATVRMPFTLPRPAGNKLVGTDISFVPGDTVGGNPGLRLAAADPADPDLGDRPLSVALSDSLATGVGISNRTVNGHPTLATADSALIFDVVGRFDVFVSGTADGEARVAIAATVRPVPNPDDLSTWIAEPLS